MIEFRRNPRTGELEAYRDGVLVGPVATIGDEVGRRDRDESEPGKE